MNIGLILMGAAGIPLVALLIYLRRQRGKGEKITIRRNDRRNHLYVIYRIFNKIPFTKRYFLKFQKRLSMLYPSDVLDVNRMATSMMTRSSLMAIGSLVIMLILCKGDLFYILISIITVYVIFTNSLTSSVDKLELKLLKQFTDFITDCRSNYHTVGMVDDAIFMCIEDLPHEIRLHVSRIYDIMISTKVEEKVEEYTDIAPNRFLQMFAAVCATIQEFGDKRLENGESLFLMNLEYIKTETYIEINKIEKNNYLFSGLIVICIVPVFTLKLIAGWATNIMDLSSFYNGAVGMLVMTLTFVSSLVCFELISQLKQGKIEEEKEHKLLERLAGLAGVRAILTTYTNAHYSKALRIDNDLKMTGDHISPQAFLLKRLLTGAILALVTLALLISSNIINRKDILHNFANAFDESVVPDEEYREEMKLAAEAYLSREKKIKNTPEERARLVKEIEENEYMREDLAEDIADTVISKADEFKHSYFKWYNLLIMLGVGVIGFYIPIWYLMYQMTVMKMSMEDEVAQFRSLALILMNVDGMNLDTILEWMERFAFCFRQTISECIINLESSTQGALAKMKERETFPPFIRFVNNLMNIDDVGVAAAFDEVVTEQENYKDQRKLNNDIMLERKSNIGKLIAFIPAGFCVVGYLIMPFAMMAWKMLNDLSGALQF